MSNEVTNNITAKLTVDNIPLDDLLGVLLRNGCREYCCPPRSICEAIAKADISESFAHIRVNENGVWEVWDKKAWLSSEVKRQELIGTMDKVKAGLEEKKQRQNQLFQKLVDKWGKSEGVRVFNQIINGELPELKEKFDV